VNVEAAAKIGIVPDDACDRRRGLAVALFRLFVAFRAPKQIDRDATAAGGQRIAVKGKTLIKLRQLAPLRRLAADAERWFALGAGRSRYRDSKVGCVARAAAIVAW
jgi:hypothetical protein